MKIMPKGLCCRRVIDVCYGLFTKPRKNLLHFIPSTIIQNPLHNSALIQLIRV